MTKTDHGALTVDDDPQDYDLELTWAGRVLRLNRSDVKKLKKLGGKDGEFDKGEQKFVEDLAERLSEAFG